MKIPWAVLAPNLSKASTSRLAEGLYCAAHPKGNFNPLKSALCLSWYGVIPSRTASLTFRSMQ